MYLWIGLWQMFNDKIKANNWFLTFQNLLVESDRHLKCFQNYLLSGAPC